MHSLFDKKKKHIRFRSKSVEITPEPTEKKSLELKPINWTTKAILSPHKLEDEYNINCEAAATFGVVCTGTKPKGDTLNNSIGNKNDKVIPVSIKIFHKDKAKMEIIKIEIELLQSLNWPGLIKFESIHETPSTLGLVVETLEDDLLSVADDDIYTEHDASIYIKQIVSTLTHMHKNMIVNIPIRPENFFFSNRAKKQIKLVDFRNVIIVDNQRVGGPFVKQSGIFVAPEMRSGEAYGKFSDMWTLGVTISCLLSGGPYFKFKKGTSIPVLDKSPWSKISEKAKDIVINLLSTDTSARVKCHELLGDDWINGFLTRDKDLKPLYFTQECLAEYKTLVLEDRIIKSSKSSLFLGEGGNFYREIDDQVRLHLASKTKEHNKSNSVTSSFMSASPGKDKSKKESSKTDSGSEVPTLQLGNIRPTKSVTSIHFRTRKLPTLESSKTSAMVENEMLEIVRTKRKDPSYGETVLKDLKSFSLLFVMLDKDLAEDFEYFLANKIYSKENYDFWIDAVEYGMTEDLEKRKELSLKIHEDYLTAESMKEINVPKTIHQPIEDRMGAAEANLFDEARSHIWQLLMHDSFMKFIESDFFVDKYFLYDPTWATLNLDT